MKSFLKSLIVFVVAALALTTVSFAASYNDGKVGVTYSDESSVSHISGSDMLTVMVVKSDVALGDINSDAILFIDQGTPLTTFFQAGSSEFGVKGGSLETGTYAMYIGSTSSEVPAVQYFTVATAESDTVTTSTGVEFTTKTAEVYVSDEGEPMRDYIFLVNVGDTVNTNLFDYTATLKFNSEDNVYSKTYLIPEGMLPSDVVISGNASTVYGIAVKGVPESCENFRIEPSVSAKEVQQP